MNRSLRLFLLSALAAPLAHAQEGDRQPEPRRPGAIRAEAARVDAGRPEAGRPGPEAFRAGFGADGFDLVRLIEESPEARERLGLTPEQKEKLSALRDRAREQFPGLREKAEQTRQTMRELERKPDAKDEDLLNALDATLAVEADMRRLGLKTRLEANRILTAEQRGMLEEMVRQRRERMERAMADRPREGADRRPGEDRPRPDAPRPEGDRPRPDRPEGDRPRPPPPAGEGPRGDAPWLKDEGKAGKI